MGEACARPECTGNGTIDVDGYCDECGLAPAATVTVTVTAAATAATTVAAAAAAAATAAATTAAAGPGPGGRCPRDCAGTVDPDGYCDECGLAPPGTTGPDTGPGATGPDTVGPDTGRTEPHLPSARTGSEHSGRSGHTGHTGRTGSERSASTSRHPASGRSMSGRSRSHRSTRSGGGRSVSVRSSRGSGGSGPRNRLGAGLVTVPTVVTPDPAAAVLTDPQVPERKRYCSRCDGPVGREKNGRPGRPDGYCTRCGTPYSFTPKLRRGDLVGGQYEVVGCLAHGGLGWIYLAVDRRVNDKWVVLKGLLDTGDEDALAAAVAERRFLAEVDHPNIVRIINFAEHPDLRTGAADGYIVMEYVGGRSLKDIADGRRTPDGRREPLPVEQAIAYALEALPALGYLHARGLVYCDFKIDNVIQSGDTLKIIDMGAVRRLDDEGPIYGTVGYQAPEIAAEGPSPASDLYTVARTLAVLSFDFRGYTTTHRHSLPGPEDVPLFAEHESYYRLLLRATDPDPARRFASAEEMADQLTGVLREILAQRDGRPRPALSTLFGPELRVVETGVVETGVAASGVAGSGSTARGVASAGAAPGTPGTAPLRTAPLPRREAALALPVPRVDPADPNAGFLATLVAADPGEALAALAAAPVDSLELRLRALRARLELDRGEEADRALADLEQDHPDDWRVVWYRGLRALLDPQSPPDGTAVEAFDALYDAFPGESAPKLALALCAELLGRSDDAAEFHRLVWGTDHGYVSAAFGLARARLAAGDRPGAVRVLESVPATSSHHTDAVVAAVRARLRGRPAGDPLAADLTAASARIAGLALDARRREQLSVEVLDTALAWLAAGAPGPAGPAGPSGEDGTAGAAGAPGAPGGADGGTGPAGAAAGLTVLGRPAVERELRFALEHSYRVLARLADRAETRIEMVERANRARPRTWV